MRRWLAVLLCCLLPLSCCACSGAEEQPEGTAYQVYFMWRDLEDASGGGALEAEDVYLRDLEDAEPAQVAEALLAELLDGPLSEELKSPIPAGTTLLSLDVEGSRALVDLSAAYGTLSGMALTLADYAVTLTLTQIPEISLVKITVRGQELAYRDRQTFSERDVLLAPEGDVVNVVAATLYFLDSGGALAGEERLLSLYEGDTQVGAVAQALENGPESKELSPVLPEGFRVRSVWLEEDVCYVNLSTAVLEELPAETDLSAAILALGRSLCSLEAVSETRFLADGEFAGYYGSVSIAEPITG